MAGATLADIRTKVRRLTRSPSTAQLSDADIDNYVNCFILYDMPEHLRLFALRSNLTFFIEPNRDKYSLSVLEDQNGFIVLNNYVTFHDPVYIAGYRAVFTQSQDQFYRIYPKTSLIARVASGDGVTTTFNGTLSSIPVAENQVLFSSFYTDGAGSRQPLELHDDGVGNLSGDGFGTINYLTGAFNLNFTNAPDLSADINAQTFTYVAARPDTMLYYDNAFWFRPIPDQPYRVEIEAYRNPLQILTAGTEPELAQWWQYIAYGAAKKVLEDRIDMESVQLIMPEFKQQELLVLRRTIVQHSNERVATIYTENIAGQYGPGWYSGGGNL